MKRKMLEQFVKEYVSNSVENIVQKEAAIFPDLVGVQLYDVPIIGIASSDDEYFKLCKNEEVIGSHYMMPVEWLPSARSIISFFFPLTDSVCKSNRQDPETPSALWLHARKEGQDFLNCFGRDMKAFLEAEGFTAAVPSLDTRFRADTKQAFTSNWSERHTAYACGLGTFGLSKGLITYSGMAGRFISVITDMELVPDRRSYHSYEEYCSKCGACIKRCPVGAISKEYGKDHVKCGQYLDKTEELFSPRYGCGKCQVQVPCERKIPAK